MACKYYNRGDSSGKGSIFLLLILLLLAQNVSEDHKSNVPNALNRNNVLRTNAAEGKSTSRL